jgi:hypothetical protein
MYTPAFSVVKTYRTAIEADLRIAALRSAGFHPLELNTASNFALYGVDISYHVEVPTEEVGAAKNVLKSFDDSTHAA